MGSAIRLTFEYRGQHVELVASEPVDLVIPDAPAGQQGLSVGSAPAGAAEEPGVSIGYRVDILNARGQRIHSRPLDNPIREVAQAVPAEPERPVTNHQISMPTGRFLVLVPGSG